MSLLKRMPPRRRRRGLTDYRKRYRLVKSGLPRLVIRRTGRYIIVQVVKSREGGDETLLTITSKKLLQYGWKAGLKNLPAAYLTGLLAGVLAAKKGVGKVIADIGLHSPVPGSRVFAALKGFMDAGVDVPAGEEIFPDEERLRGEHIKKYYEMIRGGEEAVETRQFSKVPGDVYLRLDQHFEEVKERILKEADAG